MHPVYRGVSRQYGYGLGSLFKSAFRMVTPVLSSVAKSVLPDLKRIATRQGIGAISDVMSGYNPKEVVKARAKAMLKGVGSTALKKLRRINKSRPVKVNHSRLRHRRGHIANLHHAKAKRNLDVFD